MKHELRISLAVVALGGALGAGGCAAPQAAGTAATAQADRCFDPTRIKRQEILSDREIRFELDNGEVWTNTLKRDCHGLKFEGGFSWSVRGTQVCANEQIITVRNAGTICVLGDFARTAG